jgi:hypothetical protein
MAMFNFFARRRTHVLFAVTAVTVALAGVQVAGAQPAPPVPNLPPYLQNFPNFAPKLTPQLPGDVNIDLKKYLENLGNFPQVQREFDLNAWQMFLSVNWPTANDRRPALQISDAGAPRWTLWQDSSSIFQVNGAPPSAAACSPSPAALNALAPGRDLSQPVSKGLPAFNVQANGVANLANEALNKRTTRFLGVLSAVGELNAANLGSDIKQAFSGPLIDQYGNFVFYEILIDPNEVKYLCDNKLYNINGQVDFFQAQKTVAMPTGQPNQDGSGSYELKLAWRVMQKQCSPDPTKPNPPCDDLNRYFVQDAYIMDQGPDGKPVQRKVKVGLVGMHIGHKSETSPQWIWATFEQVDNLSVDQVAHPQLQASFNNANCPICVTDLQPQGQKVGKDTVYPRIPVQVSRTIPIPADKVALNNQAATALAAQNSVWQYYQLIDTQWPTDPTAKPANPLGGLPNAVANKPGGNPTPVFLTNITMETYFQGGNQPACNQVEGGAPNCPPSYDSVTPGTAIAAYSPNPVNWTTTLNNQTQPQPPTPPIQPGISTQILATESCMGCHSSAGIWMAYDPLTQTGRKTDQLTGDFSWLMSQKAQWYYSGP